MNALALLKLKLKEYRRIEYLLTKPEFQGIEVPVELVERGDSRAVSEYLRLTLGFEEWTMAELRDRAARLRVYPIFGLTKSELIQRIRDESQKGQAKSQ